MGCFNIKECLPGVPQFSYRDEMPPTSNINEPLLSLNHAGVSLVFRAALKVHYGTNTSRDVIHKSDVELVPK